MTTDPSPTADATLLTDPLLISPTAKTLGNEVSYGESSLFNMYIIDRYPGNVHRRSKPGYGNDNPGKGPLNVLSHYSWFLK